MSGGHYDYSYFKIQQLADDIERDFLKDGKYMTEDWNAKFDYYYDKQPMIEADRLEGIDDNCRAVVLKEIKSLIRDLNRCAARAKELEWFMSGDASAESYYEQINKIRKKK